MKKLSTVDKIFVANVIIAVVLFFSIKIAKADDNTPIYSYSQGCKGVNIGLTVEESTNDEIFWEHTIILDHGQKLNTQDGDNQTVYGNTADWLVDYDPQYTTNDFTVVSNHYHSEMLAETYTQTYTITFDENYSNGCFEVGNPDDIKLVQTFENETLKYWDAYDNNNVYLASLGIVENLESQVTACDVVEDVTATGNDYIVHLDNLCNELAQSQTISRITFVGGYVNNSDMRSWFAMETLENGQLNDIASITVAKYNGSWKCLGVDNMPTDDARFESLVTWCNGQADTLNFVENAPYTVFLPVVIK